MKVGKTQLGVGIVLCLLTVPMASGQTAPVEKPPMAEKVFKNVQVLKGIPVDQFMGTMGFFSASLGMTCTDCHVGESGGNWEKYADDTELKQTTRKMMVMVSALNRTYFNGRREVTCYSCHRGGDRPRVTPSLIEMYGPPAPTEPPDAIDQATQARPADPIFDKYIQAIGGAQHLGALTSFVAKGTYVGFGETDKTPMEISAKAPNQRSMVVHTPIGDTTTVYDGRAGWSAAPGANSPVPVLEL
ncbi:MAG TPA: c-type cytochrome, partial [Bryobacteraceae bacterium]|nr:c-type cytochrome [Bryobacteraceae bacterium]